MSASRRLIVADMFSLVIFSFFVNGSIELLSGLTFAQMLQSRVTAIPVNMVIARPYGLFRDAIMRFGGAENGGFLRKTGLDITSYILFQVPVYTLILLSAGVATDAIMTAVAGQMVGFVLAARPYGLWLQFCRTRFTKVAVAA
ncbi:L-alanine exporter AlaE [Parendozoicomonas haliclonae]|uniref:L-alanine exporter AlaE n=1 Tax=Parendozoicomonas haliclonae TaxID=1960125 RepID=A0A1X7AME9_9GAMM|nr:L-alanine exporter AlaE [Parendozoicomonas haliclonae]SMA49433.1 L-alanine exporter AlaE [Parendozoicomonas haliclonae]